MSDLSVERATFDGVAAAFALAALKVAEARAVDSVDAGIAEIESRMFVESHQFTAQVQEMLAFRVGVDATEVQNAATEFAAVDDALSVSLTKPGA